MDGINLSYLVLIAVGLGVIVIIGGAVVIRGTVAKTKWGINLSQVTCPQCQTVQPSVRKPTDPYDFKWGGWTCPNCGTKMDKWGRVRVDA